MMQKRILALLVVVLSVFYVKFVSAQEQQANTDTNQETCIDESSPEYKNIMTAKEFMKKGESALQSGDYKTAESLFRKALELTPQNSDAKLKLAWTCAFAGKYQDALKLTDELLATNPKFAAALLVKGVALAGLGNKQEAENAFNGAFSQEPKEERFYLFYAQSMARFGEKETAAKLESVFKSHSDWYSVAAEAGLLYHMAGEHQKAVELLFAGCQGLDHRTGFVVPLVISAAKAGKTEDLLAKVKSLQKENTTWLKVLEAGLLINKNDFDEAETLLNSVQNSAKELPALNYFKGVVLLENGKEKEAAEALQAALSSDPIRCLVLNYYVAQHLEQISNKELALSAYKRFCNLTAKLGVMKNLRQKAESRIKEIESEFSI